MILMGTWALPLFTRWIGRHCLAPHETSPKCMVFSSSRTTFLIQETSIYLTLHFIAQDEAAICYCSEMWVHVAEAFRTNAGSHKNCDCFLYTLK